MLCYAMYGTSRRHILPETGSVAIDQTRLDQPVRVCASSNYIIYARTSLRIMYLYMTYIYVCARTCVCVCMCVCVYVCVYVCVCANR